MKFLFKTQLTKCLSVLMFCVTLLAACQKDLKQKGVEDDLTAIGKPGNEHGHLQQTKEFSADVAVRWMNMQLNMLRVPMPAGVTAPEAQRAVAYCGIALYEAVAPGMPAYRSLGGQLIDLPALPKTMPGFGYHWGASANAALAYMNRHLFPQASAENKAAADNLENELQAGFATETEPATLERSIAFGRSVAEIIFNWSQSDGTSSFPSPATYILPVGDGLWEKTPPNFAGPVNPFSSMRRLLVKNSDDGAGIAGPPAYSKQPGSEFYAMVKDVYDKSQALTAAQIAHALFYRDAPGYPGGGAQVAIIAQTIEQSGCFLDKAALAYAKVGIAMYDGLTICFNIKYQVNLVRPITYIRNVLGYPNWNTQFPTPGHPEFPSAHATVGGVNAVMLTDVFGENFQLNLDHYNYLGLPARHFDSFSALARDMADSRVYAGIHYQASVDKGLWMGSAISKNILNKVKFLK